MPYQNIGASLTPDEVQAIEATFQDVLTRIPFLVNLTAKERRTILKTDPDSVSFVQNALTAGPTSGPWPTNWASAGKVSKQNESDEPTE
uniref:Uncharacterized protein n=1 Tax=Candidatus Kentrum sp. FW TaxID=2126338 RepID=A0A450TG26_9GAMM|nr:MAG: hypothetical protein BECKFW1821B_GA0114236_111318 [Candidatus Kentron sp. FW]